MLSIFYVLHKSGSGGDKCECQALPRVLHTQNVQLKSWIFCDGLLPASRFFSFSHSPNRHPVTPFTFTEPRRLQGWPSEPSNYRMFIFKWLSKAWGPLLTIFGLLGLSCAIIAVSLTAANLTTSGGYTAAQHAAYITITTIFATLFTTIVSSYTGKLFLMRIDVALAHGANLEQLNARWRSVFGLASVIERTRNLHVALVYLCTGLITTAIVAIFSPSTTTRSYSYSPAISYGPGLCGEVLTPSQVAANQGHPY
jgi:hypothetical protein